ncbi:putative immunity protein [Dietzia sp.]|uniref:putative immunity protein n=1 Tax=Dietzia sp. TaxID=1871616 RepID=UPI002FDA5952
MILPKVRDPRMITVARGGSLSPDHHRLLALWAADCAERVVPLFEEACPEDRRPRDAISAARAWAEDGMRMMDARAAGGHAMGAARPLTGAPRFAAYAAGQAACVGHVAEHDLGAAAYAIKAVAAAAPSESGARLAERNAQRALLPAEVRDLVLEDQARRDEICWFAFAD